MLLCFTHLFHQSVEVELQSEFCLSKALRSSPMKKRIITVSRCRGSLMHSEFITQAAALNASVRPLEMPPAE